MEGRRPKSSFEKVEPIHALGFFNLLRDGIVNQIVIFDYYDPGEYYWSKFQSHELEDELEIISENMQEFLDEEEVKINGEEVHPCVKEVDLIFRRKKYPSIIFFIEFAGILRSGLNTYENRYGETVTEYDYEFYWIMPPDFRIREVLVDGDYNISGNILMVWVSKGSLIKGYEKIVFEVPRGI
ncbi:MAG: hypothetical protein DRJ51_01010 [Thermoprotei archaeon]|nr:MAG: hypothetical protein DRJ51_01010 [Thermoprotei archaeon]RLF01119.1 MAG: hypothetical protein DRJ59_06675 [Thermoprotei archaeon]